MSNQALNTLLQQAGLSYQQKDYQACLALLNDCLLLSPQQALLLSNRALAHYQMGSVDLALQDLYSCIQTDHLNYIAYFNLFSIFHLQQQHEPAFQHLSFCLSSAYTILGREQRDSQIVQKAIVYCFNNKQALLLRSLLHLEKEQYSHCLEMLSLTLQHQNSPVIRAQITAVIRQVSQKGGLSVPEQQTKFVGGKSFKLKTILPLPSSQKYPQTIQSMLKQFNYIYQRLVPSHNHFSPLPLFNSNQSIPSSLAEHSLSYLKEDRTNCLTTHNSTLANQSQCHTDDPHLSRGSCTLFADSTRHLGGDSTHSVIPEQTSSIADNWSQSVASSKPADQVTPVQAKPTYVGFQVYWVQLNSQKSFQHLYSVMHYNSQYHHTFRSSLANSINGICQWKELQAVSQPVALSSYPSALLLKVYQKRFDTFQDQLLGQASLYVDRLGSATISLTKGENECGSIAVGVFSCSMIGVI